MNNADEMPTLREQFESFKRERNMLLGEQFHTPLKERHFQSSITVEQLPLVNLLHVLGKATVPTSLFLKIATLATGRYLQQIRFLAPLQLEAGERRILHTVTRDFYNGSLSGSGEQFEIYSSNESKSKWTLHCSGFHAGLVEIDMQRQYELSNLKERYQMPLEFNTVYDQLAQSGIHLGEDLRGITEAWRKDNGLIAAIRYPLADQTTQHRYSMPTLLETCFQSVLALFTPSAHTFPLITYVEGFYLDAWPSGDIWVEVYRQPVNGMPIVDMMLLDSKGKNIGIIQGVKLEYFTLTEYFRSSQS